LKALRQIANLANVVATLFAHFAGVPLLVDNAEIETKSDQRKRGHPEGPIGPIQKHATISQHIDRLKNASAAGLSAGSAGDADCRSE
jgi:hypothetical protein